MQGSRSVIPAIVLFCLAPTGSSLYQKRIGTRFRSSPVRILFHSISLFFRLSRGFLKFFCIFLSFRGFYANKKTDFEYFRLFANA